jgi:hypothetical protein
MVTNRARTSHTPVVKAAHPPAVQVTPRAVPAGWCAPSSGVRTIALLWVPVTRNAVPMADEAIERMEDSQFSTPRGSEQCWARGQWSARGPTRRPTAFSPGVPWSATLSLVAIIAFSGRLADAKGPQRWAADQRITIEFTLVVSICDETIRRRRVSVVLQHQPCKWVPKRTIRNPDYNG